MIIASTIILSAVWDIINRRNLGDKYLIYSLAAIIEFILFDMPLCSILKSLL